MNVRKLTFMAVLLAAALIIHTAEAQLPPFVPIPGVRPGLANVITLAALVLLGRRSAGVILILRIILGGIIGGTGMSVVYSFCGGIMCFLVESILLKKIPVKFIWFVSIIGAVAHNFGQVCAAVVLTKTPEIAWYMVVLLLSGILSGFITGLITMYMIRHGNGLIEKLMKENGVYKTEKTNEH